MRDFIISETDRSGFDRAAQWHDQMAWTAAKTLNQSGLAPMQRQALKLARHHHELNARELRRILAQTRLAAPASPPAAGEGAGP